MAPVNLNPKKTVALLVDFQSSYFSGLSWERWVTVPQQAREFADMLREQGLPSEQILWVAKEQGVVPTIYSQSFMPAEPVARPRLRTQLGLDQVDAQDDETIVIKSTPSAFQRTLHKNGRILSPLTAWLRKNGWGTLVVAGGLTTQCVEVTVRNALQEGFRVVVVSDRLFDSKNENRDDKEAGMANSNPEWHRALLETELAKSGQAGKAFYTLSHELDIAPMRKSRDPENYILQASRGNGLRHLAL